MRALDWRELGWRYGDGFGKCPLLEYLGHVEYEPDAEYVDGKRSRSGRWGSTTITRGSR